MADPSARESDDCQKSSDDYLTIRRSDSGSRIGRFGDFVGRLSVDHAWLLVLIACELQLIATSCNLKLVQKHLKLNSNSLHDIMMKEVYCN
ncbi:MAG: hypothetical protein Q8P23_03610 [bacterium]|nr:hypothetical protein [bacterium]MDZ4345970.1 hypothetical protein [Candidatus Binatia bacterium]